MSTPSRIRERAATAAFAKPLITNVLRGLVVEAIVAEALSADWTWCSEDYSAWDFEHRDGARLEVKQSASRQSWAKIGDKASASLFDVAARTGRWEGPIWLAEAGRNAQLYLFGHHAVVDASADHCDPQQWKFFVIASSRLPPTKRISLVTILRLTEAVHFSGLSAAVEECRLSLTVSVQDAPRNKARQVDP